MAIKRRRNTPSLPTGDHFFSDSLSVLHHRRVRIRFPAPHCTDGETETKEGEEKLKILLNQGMGDRPGFLVVPGLLITRFLLVCLSGNRMKAFNDCCGGIRETIGIMLYVIVESSSLPSSLPSPVFLPLPSPLFSSPPVFYSDGNALFSQWPAVSSPVCAPGSLKRTSGLKDLNFNSIYLNSLGAACSRRGPLGCGEAYRNPF